MFTAARYLTTVLLLLGTAFDGLPSRCAAGVQQPANRNQQCRCSCCQGAMSKCTMASCSRTANPQDRSSTPRPQQVQTDRQLSPSTTASLSTLDNDPASGHSLLAFSLIGTALSVPTLQAQHVRIQA